MADPNIPNIDARVAVLERIASDTRELLADLRSEMRQGFDRIDRRMEALGKRQHSDFLWLLTIMLGGYASTLAGFAGVLGVMAHGFKWI